MKPLEFILGVSIASSFLAGCEQKPKTVIIEERTPTGAPRAATKTFETARLGKEIDRYEKESTAPQAAAVQKAFAELDTEIAELNERAAKTDGADRAEAEQKAVNLRTYRSAEEARFLKAKGAAALGTVGADGRSAGEKIEDSARRTGAKLKDTGEKIGDALRDATK